MLSCPKYLEPYCNLWERHPKEANLTWFTDARYLYRKKEDFQNYINYVEEIIDELLSNYKITGIWLDLIAAWFGMGEEYIPIEKIYAHIREKHPDVLISWKQGATGTEDFASPENSFHSLEESIRNRFGDTGAERARRGQNNARFAPRSFFNF